MSVRTKVRSTWPHSSLHPEALSRLQDLNNSQDAEQFLGFVEQSGYFQTMRTPLAYMHAHACAHARTQAHTFTGWTML